VEILAIRPQIKAILRIFIAHAQSGRISTSDLKSDVIVVFLDPDFLSDGEISAIRPKMMVILRIFIAPLSLLVT